MASACTASGPSESNDTSVPGSATAEPATSDPPPTAASGTAAPEGDATTSESPTTSETPTTERLVGRYGVEIVSTRPHDPTAYTQGLELDGDRLLETTGRFGESDRRWVDPGTGEILEEIALPDELFGEGATIIDSHVLQVTWRAGVVITADDDLVETSRGTYSGEGWGVCFNGSEVLMSNGSNVLAARDPKTFELLSQVQVIDASGQPVSELNELECVGDQVLANVYGLDTIVVIDPTSGSVDATIDASSLRPANAPADDFDYVLNGIAHDQSTGNYYLTGKWWDVMYEVRFTPLGE